MDYTDKVMEYFRNPKNMGRIENPDGVGKVGNPVCLRPDQQIHVGCCVNPISRVEEGMRTLTHEGMLSSITKTHVRQYAGPMVFLKNRLGGIWLTPEHSVLAVRLPKTLKYLRTRNKRTLEPSWYHAHDLSKGDLVVIPQLREGNTNKEYVFTPITSAAEESYRGFVHNLEVAEDHSFSSEGFCLHNCGDVMHIYIKVKDDRIDDIKFETFGCGAAIATSSVVTELAKGKTLAEAEKITNEDVVKELGGLPPAKRHCSLLAEDGLRGAIKDYREKKHG